MARVQRYRRAIAGLALLAGLWLSPAAAEDRKANDGPDFTTSPFSPSIPACIRPRSRRKPSMRWDNSRLPAAPTAL